MPTIGSYFREPLRGGRIDRWLDGFLASVLPYAVAVGGIGRLAYRGQLGVCRVRGMLLAGMPGGVADPGKSRGSRCDRQLTHDYALITLRGGAATGTCPAAARQPFEEDPPNERNLTKPRTICPSSPLISENLRHSPTGSRRTNQGSRKGAAGRCLLPQPVAGLSEGVMVGVLPVFLAVHPKASFGVSVYPVFRRNDPCERSLY